MSRKTKAERRDEALRVARVSYAITGQLPCETCVHNSDHENTPECQSPDYKKMFRSNLSKWLSVSFIYEEVCNGKWYKKR